MKKALALALLLLAGAAWADEPRARCASCSLIPTGATAGPIFNIAGIAIGTFNASVDSNFVYWQGQALRLSASTAGFALYVDPTAGVIASAAPSGSNGFSCENEGCRYKIGPDTYVTEQGTRLRAGQGVDGTAGSGTGITANQTSTLAHQVHKLTVTSAAMTAAATTDVTIWTTPANTRLERIVAEVTQTFTGGALSAVTVQCGSAAGGNQYLLANSVFTAVNTWGDSAAEIGAGLLSATVADMGASAGGIPGAITISCRFTCTGANCNAATQGSVTFEIEHVVYP